MLWVLILKYLKNYNQIFLFEASPTYDQIFDKKCCMCMSLKVVF